MLHIWFVVGWSLCFSSWALVVRMVSSIGMFTYKSFMSKVISLWLSLIMSLVRFWASSVELFTV